MFDNLDNFYDAIPVTYLAAKLLDLYLEDLGSYNPRRFDIVDVFAITVFTKQILEQSPKYSSMDKTEYISIMKDFLAPCWEDKSFNNHYLIGHRLLLAGYCREFPKLGYMIYQFFSDDKCRLSMIQASDQFRPPGELTHEHVS